VSGLVGTSEKQTYGVFGHFYSVELASKEVIECRSVLEITTKARIPKDHAELSALSPDAVFIMMNPGSSRPWVEVNNRIRAKAIHKLAVNSSAGMKRCILFSRCAAILSAAS
jgi:hypothetical protein